MAAESQWWGERVGDHIETDIDAGWLQQLGLPEEAVVEADCTANDQRIDELAATRVLWPMNGTEFTAREGVDGVAARDNSGHF